MKKNPMDVKIKMLDVNVFLALVVLIGGFAMAQEARKSNDNEKVK